MRWPWESGDRVLVSPPHDFSVSAGGVYVGPDFGHRMPPATMLVELDGTGQQVEVPTTWCRRAGGGSMEGLLASVEQRLSASEVSGTLSGVVVG